MFLYWDPTYYLVLIGALICGIASWNVNRTFNQYSRRLNARRLTAEDVAAMRRRIEGEA